MHLTRDGGKSWQNVTPKGLPEWAKVALIEASPFDAGTAYVAVDAHKLDDFKPYIFRTHDCGKTWTQITSGISEPAYVHAVREDPARKGLLFAGTETGIYVSFDDGDHWQSLQLNLPTTSVRDLTIHGNDLAIATHGRSFWILDDITPLRQADCAGRGCGGPPVHAGNGAADSRGRDLRDSRPAASAQNPPDGAVLDYDLGKAPAGEVSLEVVDARGHVAFHTSSVPMAQVAAGVASGPGDSTRRRPLSKAVGMHRVVWNLRYPVPAPIPGAAYDERPPRGILALPGTYQVKLTVDGRTYTAPLTVKNDPRVHVTDADLKAQFDLATQLMADLERNHVAVNQILDLRDQLAGLQKRLAGDPQAQAIVSAAADLDRKADVIENVLYQSKAKTGEELLNYPTELNSKIAYLEDEVDFGDTAPTTQFREMTKDYEQQLAAAIGRWEALQAHELKALNDQLHAKGIGTVFVAR